MIGGLIVGLTSVGSGSLMIVLMLFLYPLLSAGQLVGTDLTQAVPLTAAAALGALVFGHVEFGVTASIVLGSVPAVLIGSFLSSRAPDRYIRPIITFVIFASGLKYIGVGTTALGWILCAVALGGGCYWLARTRPWTNGRLASRPGRRRRATVPGPAAGSGPGTDPPAGADSGANAGFPGRRWIPGPTRIPGPARPAASPPPDRARARAPARSRVAGGDGRGGHRRGEVLRALQRGEVPRAVEADQPGVGEELAEPVGPLAGEQRVMFRPEHGGRHRDPVRRAGHLLGHGGGDRARPRPVPGDRCGEGAGAPVHRDQVLEVLVAQLKIRPGPVRPEMTQVGADQVRPAVDELVDRLSWWNGWYQNSCCARGLRIRSPIPGSGGDTTSALTRSGRSRATAWAIRLPMS